MFRVMPADIRNDGTNWHLRAFIPGRAYLLLQFLVIQFVGDEMGKALVRFLPVVAHLGQRKRLIDFSRFRVGLVSRWHHRWKRLVMRIRRNKLECRRFPMGYMRQEILDRPPLWCERFLLLPIAQMINEPLKTRVIFLQVVQNALLCGLSCSQITNSSL